MQGEENQLDNAIARVALECSRAENTIQLLTDSLLAAHDEEQRRIARSLHDELNQELAMLSVDLGLLLRLVPRVAPAQIESIFTLHQSAEAYSTDLGERVYRRHPAGVEDLGLIAVLRSHCTEFSLRENIAVVFTANQKLDLTPHLAIFLYRIVEESLRNVAKHARATEVCVRISKEPEGIRASIVDNGCGFKSEEAWGKKGLGLVRMRERAQAVDGQLIVRSTPGMHTRIEVYAPVKWDDPN